MGWGRLPTPTVSWAGEPVGQPGAGARPGRVTHCCFEHADQNFGSLDRGPQAIHREWDGLDWRASELNHEPEEIIDAEHELGIERVAAIDVAKASGKVCVRLPGKSGRRVSPVWDVAATSGAVADLAAQLRAQRVQRVTVESTSDYWRIWFYLLEAAGLDVQLVNAREGKNVPGRPKTGLLTEPPRGGGGGGVPVRVRLSRFAARYQRWRSAAGFGCVGGAGLGCSGGHRRSVPAVSA